MESMIMIVAMLAMLYFFMIRPENKRKKEAQNMRDSLTVGDVITTIGGIVGRVIALKEDTFVLETGSDRTKIRFRRAAVQAVTKLDMETPAQK